MNSDKTQWFYIKTEVKIQSNSKKVYNIFKNTQYHKINGLNKC